MWERDGNKERLDRISEVFQKGEFLMDDEQLYGPKVKSDSKFKAKARLRQSKFRHNVLHGQFDKYGSVLCEKAGSDGENFYNGFPVFNEVKKRYEEFQKPLYCNMLRSEHIPYNLFVPLKNNSDLAIFLFNDLLKISINKIENILIEYAPSHKEEYLDDNTSFDTYVEYTYIDGKRGILGIEVKFSERAYPYGKTEKIRMNNPKSIYNVLKEKSKIYFPDCYESLKTPTYKQMWRNQLLGEAILEKDKEFDEFTSILVYPSQNKYIEEKATKYKEEFLRPSSQKKFMAITYEDYLDALQRYNQEDNKNEEYDRWITYLRDRYIID